MNMQPCCPMMLMNYPSYSKWTIGKNYPCKQCLYRNYNKNILQEPNYYETDFYYSEGTENLHPEMMPVPLREILE